MVLSKYRVYLQVHIACALSFLLRGDSAGWSGPDPPRRSAGTKANGHDINLNLIPLVLMLDHFDDWTTDWDSELTDDEIKLVKEPKWREGIVSNFNH